MTDTDARLALARKIRAIVMRRGWARFGVGASETEPSLAYTIGLHQTYAHPEIVIVGLSDAMLSNILATIGAEVAAGRRFWADLPDGRVLKNGYAVTFVPVPAERKGIVLSQALAFYGSLDDIPVLQCVWPDKEGRWPWDPRCVRSVAAKQPVFGRAVQAERRARR